MAGVDKALCHKAPLHCSVLVAEHGEAFVDGPADRAVVDDEVLVVEASETVPAVGIALGDILIAEPEAHIAYDDVVGLNGHGIVGNADAVAGSRLSGDGDVAYTYI